MVMVMVMRWWRGSSQGPGDGDADAVEDGGGWVEWWNGGMGVSRVDAGVAGQDQRQRQVQ
jgi:hypothetical protein